MEMKDELISFETAKLAKEKGFNELCFCYYKKDKLLHPYLENGSSTDTDFRVDLEDLLENHNDPHIVGEYYSAPTQSLLQRWLREKHNIHVNVDNFIFHGVENNPGKYDYHIVKAKDSNYEIIQSYEEALEKGLQEGLKLIK